MATEPLLTRRLQQAGLRQCLLCSSIAIAEASPCQQSAQRQWLRRDRGPFAGAFSPIPQEEAQPADVHSRGAHELGSVEWRFPPAEARLSLQIHCFVSENALRSALEEAQSQLVLEA